MTATIDEALLQIVGAVVDTYPDAAPEGTALPHAVIRIIGEASVPTSKNRELFQTCIAQIDVYSSTRKERNELGVGVKQAMFGTADRYDFDAGFVSIDSVEKVNGRTLVELEETPVYGKSQDFQITYKEQ